MEEAEEAIGVAAAQRIAMTLRSRGRRRFRVRWAAVAAYVADDVLLAGGGGVAQDGVGVWSRPRGEGLRC